MSEQKTEITNKTAGYSFHIKIERETRLATEAKYPDKSVVSVSLNGNDDLFETMIEHAKKARVTIAELLDEDVQETPSEVAIESEKAPDS